MKQIQDVLKMVTKELGLPAGNFALEHPKDESHGDYSSNVAMILAKQVAEKPRELAQKIVEQLNHLTNESLDQIVEKIEVAGPGFINFYLKESYLVEQAQLAREPGYGKNEKLAGQKTFVEYTDPNPFKDFHIGHLMSNTIGESLVRILVANGATVKRANYQGDVGLHVAKSIWGWQKKMAQDKLQLSALTNQSLKERITYLGQAYAYGATKYEEDEGAKAEMDNLNKQIYDGLAEGTEPTRTVLVGRVMELYHLGRAWSLENFEILYKRLGTKFDKYFFESEAGPVGLKVVDEGLKKGVLEVGKEGAVVFPGEKYGLHTRVFRNKLGLPTYEGKELGLAKTKWERWEYDKSYIITANEIDEYFKVLLKAVSLLYPKLGERTMHLSHGMMKLTTGKMSSRTGKVITGEGLLNELKEVVLLKMGVRDIKDREKVADQVAVGALKYTVLKQAVGGDIVYEPEKITNMEGDTGPYLQYTYVRAQSVLAKANKQTPDTRLQTLELNAEEKAIMTWLYRYPEVVEDAGEKYAPHMIASYIYELATRFNTFYNQHHILPSKDMKNIDDRHQMIVSFRLLLTQAVANVLESGLGLLGIQAPKEM